MTTTNGNNIDNDDEAFKTILKGIETRMSEKILSTMYGTTRIDNKSADAYYIVQWTNESYILPKNSMVGCTSLIIAYVDKIMRDTVFKILYLIQRIGLYL